MLKLPIIERNGVLMKYTGDLSHLISILILLHKMHQTNVCPSSPESTFPRLSILTRMQHSVLFRHILQIPSPLPNSLHNALPRPLLDLRRQRLQHNLQAPLPRLLRLHHLPNDHSLQAYARPESRYLPRAISPRRLSRPRRDLPLLLHTLRNPLGFLHLARKCSHSPTAVFAAEDRLGGDNHDALSLCAGELPRVVYPELDL
jgi:hypothetical protein